MIDYEVVRGNDMKSSATCLECEHYRYCDVFCYYDVEDSDDDEAEV